MFALQLGLCLRQRNLILITCIAFIVLSCNRVCNSASFTGFFYLINTSVKLERNLSRLYNDVVPFTSLESFLYYYDTFRPQKLHTKIKNAACFHMQKGVLAFVFFVQSKFRIVLLDQYMIQFPCRLNGRATNNRC